MRGDDVISIGTRRGELMVKVLVDFPWKGKKPGKGQGDSLH